MNYSFLTTMYDRDIIIHTAVRSHGADKFTYHEKYFVKKLEKIIFYQIYVCLGVNNFIHCRRITVHGHVNIFVKKSPMQTESNQEVTLK